ncbi:MAG TPA: class I SAM-dependent methyltransferase [Candidatus Binatia bacterium]|nr:class I SAM-dependent methyltransferase [Candidatus Binatia bacterium]
MRADLYRDLYEKETAYWWHVCKRETVLSLLRSTAPTARRLNRRGLDIGCGTGYTASVLDSEWHMTGIDLSPESLDLCHKRGLNRLCRVDLTHFVLPFKTASMDLVLALDVIEHIEDDSRALAECNRILKEGGLLIVTVPAYMALWSPWDEALGHKRRYTTSTLIAAANKSGLCVKRISYFFLCVLPAAIVVRQFKRLLMREAGNYSTDFIPVPRWLNTVLVHIGRLERWFIDRFDSSLPFGLSVISVLEKPSSKESR